LKKKIVIIFFCVLVINIFLFYPVLQDSKVENSIALKRIYKNFNFKVNNVYEYDFRITDLRIINGKLFAEDFSNKQIKSINLQNGKIEKIYGRKGDGPAEIGYIGSWNIINDTLYVFDQHKLLLKKIYSDLEIDFYPFKLFSFYGAFQGNKYLTLAVSPNKNISHFYSIDMEEKKYHQLDVKTDFKLSASLDGRYAQNDNYIVLVPERTSQILIFDKNFQYVNTFKTIDQTPIPEIRYDGKGGYKFIDSKNVNGYRSIYKDLLIVISKVKNIKKDYSVDLYDLKKSEYLYSFDIPKIDDKYQIILAILNNDIMYVSDQEKIYEIAYKIE
jgi:hypothetical protein